METQGDVFEASSLGTKGPKTVSVVPVRQLKRSIGEPEKLSSEQTLLPVSHFSYKPDLTRPLNQELAKTLKNRKPLKTPARNYGKCRSFSKHPNAGTLKGMEICENDPSKFFTNIPVSSFPPAHDFNLPGELSRLSTSMPYLEPQFQDPMPGIFSASPFASSMRQKV